MEPVHVRENLHPAYFAVTLSCHHGYQLAYRRTEYRRQYGDRLVALGVGSEGDAEAYYGPLRV